MQRLYWGGFALLICLNILTAGNVLADNRAGARSLTPMVGYQNFDSDFYDLKDEPSYGLAAGYNITENWGIEVDARYARTEVESSPENKVDFFAFGLSGLYHFMPEQDFVPYLAVGIGGTHLNADNGGNDEDWMANFGGGFKYSLTDTTALRLDVRDIVNFSTEWTTSSDSKEKSQCHNVSAMVGLTFQFDPTPTAPPPVESVKPVAVAPVAAPAVVAPIDSDQDGVMDPEDKCPATAPGVRVDANGCPADTDGDGVADFRDACVDTPAGTPVDERGCPFEAEPIAELTLRLNFGVDKATVTPFHYRDLEKAVAFINQYPAHKIEIEGHTDSSGDSDYNRELSMRRAESVRQTLIDRYGIAAERISARGHGEDQPVASNDTAEGRQQNRRVEIEILP